MNSLYSTTQLTPVSKGGIKYRLRKNLIINIGLCWITLGAINLAQAVECAGTVTAKVVALDQVFYYNRLGAVNPSGMIYALERDVVDRDGGSNLTPGNVRLREDKRPRPLVLRVNEGDCLEVTFTNLLKDVNDGNEFSPPPDSVDPTKNPNNFGDQPATRSASFHVVGMQPKNIGSDGSNVGKNGSSLVAPGGTIVYTFYAQKEGAYLAYSTAATTGGEGNGGTLAMGLFGAVNVEPKDSTWYRSQVTQQDLALATTGSIERPVGSGTFFPDIDYSKVYPEYETRKAAEVLTINAPIVTDNGDSTSTSTSTSTYTYVAELSHFESTVGFMDTDNNKTLVGGGVSKIIAVNADGTATITTDIALDGPFPKKVGRYLWEIKGTETHRFAGLPILEIKNSDEVVHSDLNIIVKPAANTYVNRNTPINPDRDQAFREFSVIFHDEIKSVQAFRDWYLDPVLSHTLHSVRDGFAINYGTGGVGSEIIANRLGLGPLKDCVECKYEEFFLTSWALGDPSMVVDVPATVNANGLVAKALTDQEPATKAFYPDDPSNVHHSYMNDHVKFRNIHAGPKEHHIFHLHAHQWAHTPDNDNSAYLDSQSLGPASAYTYEITHNGSGNRNKTVGDSIFHCHFYPHFAQGMWAMWRVHDVLETGTPITTDTLITEGGKPLAGSRALPDNEIVAGTVIPGLVPLPGMAMAPLPGVQVTIDQTTGQVVLPDLEAGDAVASANPGYPFFIPGKAGHRPPHPPLDTVNDGGLPRHIILSGTAHSTQTRLNFDKESLSLVAQQLPEEGTLYEKAAMDFHGVGSGPAASYATPKPDGTLGNFRVNGLQATAGAPFADPCVIDLDAGEEPIGPIGTPREYRVSAIQTDMTFNKTGWHFPQQRLLVLDGDVDNTLSGLRPPEPLFFRANSGDCITFYHTNLIPLVYTQDDFQVHTPTDVIGQHIHLVKFDVTASDGSGNGWNYEDGTFSPGEVHERLVAINASVVNDDPDGKDHPAGEWQGIGPSTSAPSVCTEGDRAGQGCVQTTVQRWYVDEVLNNSGHDRTLRTVYTHDHYGPSTHQQAGLYAGLVIEPKGSIWRHNEEGYLLGGDADGGPTSWQAIIEPGDSSDETAEQFDPYREYMIEMTDFALAYRADGSPVNPPAKKEIDLSVSNDLLEVAPNCPGLGDRDKGCPEAISADDPGTMVVNYRNEPIAQRIYDGAGNQTAGPAGDLSQAFVSRTDRAITELNQANPGPYPDLTFDVQPGDPFTPLLKAYEGDKIQIRILTGGQEEGHNFGAPGLKWLFEPSVKTSGWRASQMMGISEHFEFIIPQMAAVKGGNPFSDIPYFPGFASDDIWNGMWGILRAYNGGADSSAKFKAPTLATLSSNPDGKALRSASCKGKNNFPGCIAMKGVCPVDAPLRSFKIHASTAKNLLGGPLVYNAGDDLEDTSDDLVDSGALMLVRDQDYVKSTGLLKPGTPIEPLILRANAGDCINVTLVNHLPADMSSLQPEGYSTLPMIIEGFNNNDILPSSHIGLSPQLLEYNLLKGNGLNVGFNPMFSSTPGVAAPGETVKYKWYAGRIFPDPKNPGYRTAEPVEYGAVNLLPSDTIKHVSKGLFGVLVIEPERATWVEDVDMRASARVTLADGGQFREHVLIFQNDLNLQQNGVPVRNTAEAEDPEDSGQKAFNYKTEPLWTRMKVREEDNYEYKADSSLEETKKVDFTDILANNPSDPETPIFTAKAGENVRFRVLSPGGHARNNVIQIHGHGWQEEPFNYNSTVIEYNQLSEWKGSEGGIGPGTHHNLVLTNGAGGAFNAPGDYLYRDQASFQFDGGLWGIFRVKPSSDSGTSH